ncbi:MAG: 30S ribosomal protein S1 [Thermodesulfovibrionales bacterium]|nr:30S ribosomal protein S1 [Thermodesulfovibrionales bacterium]
MENQLKTNLGDIETLYEETIHRVEGGAIHKGKVITIRPDSYVIDVGYKTEGIVNKSEFTEDEIEGIKEGDLVDVFVDRINEKEQIVSISRIKARLIKVWERLVEAFNTKEIVKGVIKGKTKGGYILDINGLKAFLPFSHVDIKPIKDTDIYMNNEIDVRVIKLSNLKNYSALLGDQTHMVVSRRVFIEEEREKKIEALKGILKEGEIVTGTVKNITDYGVFVDLGGIDGLLHISDISWRRVNHASEFFKVGDKGEFIVLKYDDANGKVTLGYKQKKPDPWETAESRYQSGMRVKGKVISIVDYGIFVEVEEGLEGLVHLSEIDWVSRPKHPSKYVSIGDVLDLVVLSINKENRKLSLSLKQTKPKPWDIVGQKYKKGDRIVGRVKTITDFGLFVRIPEGVDGLVHISDISWTKHIRHPSDMFRKGQRVEAVVLNIEPQKERLALSIKHLTEDPWIKEIPARYQQGQEYKGKVVKITDFGVFVEIQGGIEGVEGLVYSTEVDNSIPLQEGDEIWVRIIKINLDERKIGLSMKNIKMRSNEE